MNCYDFFTYDCCLLSKSKLSESEELSNDGTLIVTNFLIEF